MPVVFIDSPAPFVVELLVLAVLLPPVEAGAGRVDGAGVPALPVDVAAALEVGA